MTPTHGTTLARKAEIALILVLLAAAALWAGHGLWGGSAESTDAERQLADARSELVEIAGSDFVARLAPALPDVSALPLGVEEKDRAGRLLDSDAADWTEDDRRWVREQATRHGAALAALGAPGVPLDAEELLDRALPLLRAEKLLALSNREALLAGDEGAFLTGLATRLDLAERLAVQPGFVGPGLGSAMAVQALEDARTAARRPETSAATLERIAALLLHRQRTVPDAAAVFARDMVATIDAIDGAEQAVAPDAGPFALAHVAADVAALTQTCREGTCREALDRAEYRKAGEDRSYRALGDLLIPNILSGMRKLDAAEELTAVARVALAVRLHALASGRYPEDLEEVAALARLEGREESMIAALAYEVAPDGGGARLQYSPEAFDRTWTTRRGPIGRLLVWELPMVPGGSDG